MENYVSVQEGCLRFLDSYRFLSSSLQKLIWSMNTFKHMSSPGFTDPLFKKKLAYPYEKFNIENINQQLNSTKEDYWSTLNQSYPNEGDIERTNEIIEKFNLKTGTDLTMLYLKMDVLQLTHIVGASPETAEKLIADHAG